MISLHAAWRVRLQERARSYVTGALLLVWLTHCVVARGSVALLMEEPFGMFGAINPTGHAAVYLNHVCAESPTELRMCKPGEYGAVISRYHKIHKYDWVAIPLIPYLYSVEDATDIPVTVDKTQVAALRDAYRRVHLEALAPDNKKGMAPGGEWIQLVGSSYDRNIHGIQVASTVVQDERFIATFNDRHNVGHFNLLFHNCADFSRQVINIYLPHAVHRSFIADLGLTTPKQIARSLVKYGKAHPELEMSAFVIPQVPGTVKRSHAVRGVAESLIKSKKYLLPMVILGPALTGGVVIAYLADGRMTLPKDAAVFDIGDAVIKLEPVVPVGQTGSEDSIGNPSAMPSPAPAASSHPVPEE